MKLNNESVRELFPNDDVLEVIEGHDEGEVTQLFPEMEKSDSIAQQLCDKYYDEALSLYDKANYLSRESFRNSVDFREIVLNLRMLSQEARVKCLDVLDFMEEKNNQIINV